MSNTAATTPSAAAAPTMKLLVDTKSKRVVFAEAGKDVADFIFGLLAAPVGAVASLLRAADVLGSIASAGKMAADDSTKYACHCQACRASRFAEGGNKGLVQGVATYIVMDDLTVTPATANVSSAELLKELGGGVKDIDGLEERTVHVGNEEALRILKAALHSSTVLTDAFIPQGGGGGGEEGRPAP